MASSLESRDRQTHTFPDSKHHVINYISRLGGREPKVGRRVVLTGCCSMASFLFFFFFLRLKGILIRMLIEITLTFNFAHNSKKKTKSLSLHQEGRVKCAKVSKTPPCVHLPDSLVRLGEHRPIRARHGHGVVAHVDLAAAQQRLAADLQALVQDGQQEDADARRRHL